MTTADLEDIKQIMTVLLPQQTDLLRDEVIERIDSLERRLSDRIENLSSAIADALDLNNEDIDKQFRNHESRLRRLTLKTT